MTISEITSRVAPQDRHTRRHPCPICGGGDDDKRHRSIRCAGFRSADGRWIFCESPDYAGNLRLNSSTMPPTYKHAANGPCWCGEPHNVDSPPASPVRPARSSTGSNGSTGRPTPAPKRPFRFRLESPPRALQDGARLAETFPYPDAGGRPTFLVLRYEYPAEGNAKPDKRFLQARPLSDGQWEMSLEGVQRILYRQPELRAAPPGAPVFIPEGEGKVEAVRKLGLVATCASGGAGQWSKTPHAAEEFRGRQVIVLVDNDGPDPKQPANSYKGQRHAKEVATDVARIAREVRVLELPGLPLKGDVKDWIAAGGTRERLLELARTAPLAADWTPPPTEAGPAEAEPEEAWEEPIPLPGGLPPVPRLDADTLLPDAIRDWVKDEAERMQAPVEFVAVAAIALAGALIGRRLAIAPKQHDPWKVIPNLWAMPVGRPTSMKSPAIKAARDALRRLEYRAEEDYNTAIAAWRPQHADWEMRRDATEKTLRSRLEEQLRHQGEPSKAAEVARLQNQIEALKGERDTLLTQEPVKPIRRRFDTQDATTEKLVELLAENPFGLLVYRDELYAWLRSLDKQGRETDRPFYLEAADGYQPHRQDRIGRGEKRVGAVCLSVLGGIQPTRLTRYVREAIEGGQGDDGLLQRFSLLVWPDWPDPQVAFRYVDRPPNGEAHDRACTVFAWLAELTPEAVGAAALSEEERAMGAVPLLRFSVDAQPLFADWYTLLHMRLRTEEMVPALESHLGKYAKLVPALALICHLFDVAVGTASSEGGVGLRAFQRAAAWGRFLEAHARRVYASVLPESVEHAQALLDKLRAQPALHGQTVRELERKQWHNLDTPELVAAALAVLERYGWVRVVPVETAGRTRKEIHVHPTLRTAPAPLAGSSAS
jgi:Protein of unknown function (DUF3987)